MGLWAILGILVIVGVLLYMIFAPSSSAPRDAVPIIAGLQEGLYSTSRSGSSLLPSFNQGGGRVYSYTGWLLFKDFTQGWGSPRTIFSKGGAPSMTLDATSNSIIVSVKTYGTTETILIPNIPAMKWIHFAIVVDQQAVITRYVEENYGKLRHRNTRSRRLHSGSYVAGETKGRTIQINRPLPS